MRNSLIWRIAAPFILLSILIIGGLAFFSSNIVRQIYIERTQVNLLSEARLTREQALPFLTHQEFAAANDLAVRSAALTKTRVTFILADGEVIGDSETDPTKMENHFARPEVQAALQQQENTQTRFSTTLKKEMLYAAVPVIQNGKVIAVIRLAEPLLEIQSGIQKVLTGVLIAALLAIGFSILLAFLITNYTLHPLQELTRVVKQIGSGSLPEETPYNRLDELSELQFAFRVMNEQLKSQFNLLNGERSNLKAVLMNMTDGILIINAQGIIQLINPAIRNIFNFKGEESGISLVEIVRQHQLVELWQHCTTTQTQQEVSLELGSEHKIIHAIATPLGVEMAGSVLMVVQDLTRLRRLETVRRDFVSNVSHELRTPLASLKAISETLQEGALEDPPAARRFLNQMDIEIDNLTQMVRELLELSRIESGKVPLQLKAYSPCDLIARAMDRMRLQAERAGLTLNAACDPTLPNVIADPERIDQVLVNLIHNAVKFTRPGGTITVSAFSRPTEVVIQVNDTGVGIAADALTRIFERFYKADRARSGGGTGLGLSIVRHLIEAHGGRVWAESELDKGSTFFFSLPKA